MEPYEDSVKWFFLLLFIQFRILEGPLDKTWWGKEELVKVSHMKGFFLNHWGTTSQKWCWPASPTSASLRALLHFKGEIYILACIKIVWIKLSSAWYRAVARGCLHDSEFLREELQCQTCDMVSRWNMFWILLIVWSIFHCSFKCHPRTRWVLPMGADGDQHFLDTPATKCLENVYTYNCVKLC